MKTAPNFKQEITAVFGKPVAENPTQVMVEAAYRHHGLAWRYLTLEVDPADLEDAVRGARALGFAGFNCTIPHKVAVIPFLDEIAESARLMGAVNCVVRRGKQLRRREHGRQRLSEVPAGKSSIPGGRTSSSSAPAALRAQSGWSLPWPAWLESRLSTAERTAGASLRRSWRSGRRVKVDFAAWEGLFKVPADSDVVINATSIGLFPDVDAELPLDVQTLLPRMVVADVIPNPPRTRLIRGAEKKGCRVIDGLGMLVNQGVIGVKYWTGVDPDPLRDESGAGGSVRGIGSRPGAPQGPPPERRSYWPIM